MTMGITTVYGVTSTRFPFLNFFSDKIPDKFIELNVCRHGNNMISLSSKTKIVLHFFKFSIVSPTSYSPLGMR